ncbi:hypothetical protein [Mucilaginibacter sp. OK283]|jgi:hypothetical protein|uniref:hypothetical protein n=1 Tax=Mucilaginibacter sp. OK283 TaxID=1881049 RepID=UPI0008B18C23|nr:hypothetical protein [Mucilaginibacter sp. OK283]SEP26278.1 hypothetical protein SAMN05428947_109182 [Mucilaginibacter sp. OK283]
MNKEEKKYALSGIVLRYLTYKITENLRKLYLDVDFQEHNIILTAYYQTEPNNIELDLLDDIVTNSSAPIPDFSVEANIKLVKDYKDDEKHDYLIFAFFDETRYDYDL